MGNNYHNLSNIISNAIKINAESKHYFASNSKRSDFNFYIKKFDNVLDRWSVEYNKLQSKIRSVEKLFSNDRLNKDNYNLLEEKFKLLKASRNELSILENTRSQANYTFKRVVNIHADRIKDEINNAINKQETLIRVINSTLKRIAKDLYPKPISKTGVVTKSITKIFNKEFKSLRSSDNQYIIGKSQLVIDRDNDKLIFGRFTPIKNIVKLASSESINTIYLVSIVVLKGNKFSKNRITFSLKKSSPKKLLLSSKCLVVDNNNINKALIKLASIHGYCLFKKQRIQFIKEA